MGSEEGSRHDASKRAIDSKTPPQEAHAEGLANDDFHTVQ